MKKTKAKKQEKKDKQETGASTDDLKLPKHMGLKFIALQISMISFGLFLYFVLASYKAGKEKEYVLTNQTDKAQNTLAQNSQDAYPANLDPSFMSKEEYLARTKQAFKALEEGAENSEWFSNSYNQVHDRKAGIKTIYGRNCEFFDFIGKKLDLDALIATNRPFEVITPKDEDPLDTISGRIIIYTDQNATVKAIRCE